MAYIIHSKSAWRMVVSIAAIILFSNCIEAIGASAVDCIAKLESSGSYDTRPSPLGHQGKYQMGVQAMQDAGFCTLRPGTSAQTSNKTQLWNNCIPTAKAKAAGVTTNSDGSINLSSFQGNAAAQESAYAAFSDQRRKNTENYRPSGSNQNINIYKEYGGKEINGIVMTDDVIDYLVHHGGTAGAYSFLSSNGKNCVADVSVGSSLCKSAQKMND
jgi:hypothetical protein